MSRLSSALVVALALHGLLLLVRPRSAAMRPRAAPRAGTEQLLEVEMANEAAPDQPSLPDPSPAAPAQAAPASARVARGVRAAAEVTGPVDQLGAGVSDALGAEPGAAASVGQGADPGPGPAAAERKIDLGLDGHFFMRPPSEDLPRVRKPEFQRQLERSLLAADVQRGLARGNVLLGSLNSAAREQGPLRGEALFQVTVGADGQLTGMEMVQGAAADWGSVLRVFRELAARKRLRVPPGARGLRVTFSVKAKVQLPSGKEVHGVRVDGASAGPNGLTLNGDFDLADTGASGQRLVYARVVSEDSL